MGNTFHSFRQAIPKISGMFMLALCSAHLACAQVKAPIEGDCLIRLLGEHINNENVQQLIEYMGLEPPFHHLRGTDIISTQKGIRISFDSDFRLVSIVLYNSNYIRDNRKFEKFAGQLPFKLTFSGTYSELVAKLGKPSKTRNNSDTVSYKFKTDLEVNTLCLPNGEISYLAFSLKRRDKSFPHPDKLSCDSIARQ